MKIESIEIPDFDYKLLEIEGQAKHFRLAKKIDAVLKHTNPGEYQLREMWFLGNPYNEVLFEKGKSMHPQALVLLAKLGVELNDYSLNKKKHIKGIQDVSGHQVVNLREVNYGKA